MKRAKGFLLLLLFIVLAGCNDETLPTIDHHQSFVASVNILQPSVTFYNSEGGKIATWPFEKAYTGAQLIEHDRILLFGHQLSEADIYELSTGKKVTTIETGLGTTNAYYDSDEELLFMTNSESNTISSFTKYGKQIDKMKLRNYPMSMTSHNGLLYVINYKDTILSVIDIKDFQLKAEWDIEKSSNGLLIIPEKNSIFIGGHGEGSQPNRTVDILQLQNGELVQQVETSVMPVGFSRSEDEIYIVNHGANELFGIDLSGNVLWHTEVGANPFAVAYFHGKSVVAGFDDHKLYFIKDGQVEQSVATEKGPFQLLVREVE